MPGTGGDRGACCPWDDRDLRSVTELRQTVPLRICIFGAAAQAGWLADVATAVPNDATLALFGRWASVDIADTRIARHAGVDPGDASAALRSAAAAYPGDDLILLRGGTSLPPFWCERLLRALREDDVFVVSPLDNADTAPTARSTFALEARHRATICAANKSVQVVNRARRLRSAPSGGRS